MNRHRVWGRACSAYSWNRICPSYSSFTLDLKSVNSSVQTLVLASILTIVCAKPTAVSVIAVCILLCNCSSAAEHWKHQWCCKILWKDCLDFYPQQCFTARVCKGVPSFCSSPALESPSLLP